MKNSTYFRVAGVIGVISAIFILVGAGMLATTLEGGPEAFADPAAAFESGNQGATGTRRALTFGMFGFYLLLPPLVLGLRELTHERGGLWADLFTTGGLAYSLVGAIGASIALTVSPTLIQSYQTVGETQRAALAPVYVAIQTGVFDGLWNVLEKIPGGIFWLGMGWLIWPTRKYLGGFSLLLGAATLLGGLAWNLSLPSLANPLDMAYLILSAIWPAWVGVIFLLHGKEALRRKTH
jgi:hypothetical protein